MYASLQILPLRAHTLIRLHLRHCLRILEAIALEPLYQVIEDERVGTFGPIFWQHTNQQQVNHLGLMPLEGAQQVPPTEGQQVTVACLAECRGERGEGNAEAHQLMVGRIPVLNGSNQIQVGNLDILVYQLVNLAVGEVRITIEVVIGSIDDIEYLMTLVPPSTAPCG